MAVITLHLSNTLKMYLVQLWYKTSFVRMLNIMYSGCGL